jgi:hypothetical protein
MDLDGCEGASEGVSPESSTFQGKSREEAKPPNGCFRFHPTSLGRFFSASYVDTLKMRKQANQNVISIWWLIECCYQKTCIA